MGNKSFKFSSIEKSFIWPSAIKWSVRAGSIKDGSIGIPDI